MLRPKDYGMCRRALASIPGLSKRGNVLTSAVVDLATLRLSSQSLQALPGRRQGRGRLAPVRGRPPRPPQLPGQRPATGAHRKPGCSCRTAAWTWRGWTPRSGSRTCGDNGTAVGPGASLNLTGPRRPVKSVRRSGPARPAQPGRLAVSP